MTLSFELSDELRGYGRQLRDWSVREARPLAGALRLHALAAAKSAS